MNSEEDDENNYYVDSSNEQNSKSRLVVPNYKDTLSIHTNSYKLKNIDLEEQKQINNKDKTKINEQLNCRCFQICLEFNTN